MKHGEKVRALMPGKVIVAGRRRGYGRVVMVEHAHGLVTVYGISPKFWSKRVRKSLRISLSAASA